MSVSMQRSPVENVREYSTAEVTRTVDPFDARQQLGARDRIVVLIYLKVDAGKSEESR